MAFMTARPLNVAGIRTHVSRSGYTGEDGYEISVAGGGCGRALGRAPRRSEVKPIGLGARDSLRLEAGLCLYGHDIDDDDLADRGRPHLVDPEAPPRGGRLSRRRAHPARARRGARAHARRPPARGPRAGPRGRRASRRPTAASVGTVTSGGFGPSVNGPIAMGYVGTRLSPHPARTCTSSCAARRCRPTVAPCPSSRTATSADQNRRGDRHDDPLHQGPRIYPRRRRHRHRRHHRLRAGAARRRRLRRAARGRQDARQGRRGGRRRERQGGQRGLRPVSGEVVAVNGELEGAPGDGQRGPGGQGLVRQAQASPTRPSSTP